VEVRLPEVAPVVGQILVAHAPARDVDQLVPEAVRRAALGEQAVEHLADRDAMLGGLRQACAHLDAVPFDQPGHDLVAVVAEEEAARANRLVLDEVPAVGRQVLGRLERLAEVGGGDAPAHRHVTRVAGRPVEPGERLERAAVDLGGRRRDRPEGRRGRGVGDHDVHHLAQPLEPRVRAERLDEREEAVLCVLDGVEHPFLRFLLDGRARVERDVGGQAGAEATLGRQRRQDLPVAVGQQVAGGDPEEREQVRAGVAVTPVATLRAQRVREQAGARVAAVQPARGEARGPRERLRGQHRVGPRDPGHVAGIAAAGALGEQRGPPMERGRDDQGGARVVGMLGEVGRARGLRAEGRVAGPLRIAGDAAAVERVGHPGAIRARDAVAGQHQRQATERKDQHQGGETTRRAAHVGTLTREVAGHS